MLAAPLYTCITSLATMENTLDDVQQLPPVIFSPGKSFRYWSAIWKMHQTSMPGTLCAIRTLSDEDIFHFTHLIIPEERLPSIQFMESLSKTSKNDSDSESVTVLRACLLVYTVTRGHIVPRDLQLEAALASISGRDSVVIVGIGWGKTLCMVILLLLRPNAISVTISPLKRLQIMQVCAGNCCQLSHTS